MIQKVLKNVEVPQGQCIDSAAECTPVDLSPTMAHSSQAFQKST